MGGILTPHGLILRAPRHAVARARRVHTRCLRRGAFLLLLLIDSHKLLVVIRHVAVEVVVVVAIEDGLGLRLPLVGLLVLRLARLARRSPCFLDGPFSLDVSLVKGGKELDRREKDVILLRCIILLRHVAVRRRIRRSRTSRSPSRNYSLDSGWHLCGLPLLVLVWLGLGFRTGRGRRRLRRPRQIRHDLLLVLVRRRLAAKVQSAADHECGPLHGR